MKLTETLICVGALGLVGGYIAEKWRTAGVCREELMPAYGSVECSPGAVGEVVPPLKDGESPKWRCTCPRPSQEPK